MIANKVIVFAVLLAVAWSKDLKFPEHFKFGVASAAYQVEGAWNVSDKGESVWDLYAHEHPDLIHNGDNGDVACDSYHLWKQDIDLVADLGADFYRLSISWPRLLPSGYNHHISEDGKRYYSDLIDGLLDKGIEPVITLYHWDMPMKLQELGGWANPLIIDWFGDYSRVVYTLFADRVKTWITINEAWVICDVAYISGTIAPGYNHTVGGYICNKNVLMAHARAWRIYDEEFRPKYHGKVAIANHVTWMEPVDGDQEDIAELVRQYQAGRFSHAIYSKEGGWPKSVEQRIAELSKIEGYKKSILPAFTPEEIKFVKGTFDFYGLNFYSTRLVSEAKTGEFLRPWPLGDAPAFNAKVTVNPDWPNPFPYFSIYPEGMRKVLVWLKRTYGDIPILITENGRGTRGGLNDTDRIQFYRDFLEQVLLAMNEDGVNVTCYTAWTLMDNFEWMEGYENKFGLYEVDFSSPNRTRTARASAKYYTEVIRTHSLDVIYNFTMPVQRSTHPNNSQSHQANFIIFGVLVLVIIAALVAGIVAWKLKLKRKKLQEQKNGTHAYSEVPKVDDTKIALRQ